MWNSRNIFSSNSGLEPFFSFHRFIFVLEFFGMNNFPRPVSSCESFLAEMIVSN